MMTIEEFRKLDLRIAEVLEAREHPDANKLYVLDVLVGGEKKQIVAGIRMHYTTDALKGKKIVVVNNLEPAVIRGVESQGMLLAAQDENTLSVLVPERSIASGTVVK